MFAHSFYCFELQTMEFEPWEDSRDFIKVLQNYKYLKLKATGSLPVSVHLKLGIPKSLVLPPDYSQLSHHHYVYWIPHSFIFSYTINHNQFRKNCKTKILTTCEFLKITRYKSKNRHNDVAGQLPYAGQQQLPVAAVPAVQSHSCIGRFFFFFPPPPSFQAGAWRNFPSHTTEYKC